MTLTYDCELEEEILFQLVPHFLPADNPQQSEDASHIGVNGGSEVFKETEAGYEALYHPEIPRPVESTLQCLRYQLWLACQSLGSREAIDETARSAGVKDKITEHWIKKLVGKSAKLKKIQMTNPETREPILNGRALVGPARKVVLQNITAEIASELWEWLLTQPEESYAKLALLL
ncbi:hypothetical protein DFH05DRAFT_1616433 [Lentinula detonsa]|uniref:Uncharacterized protein n=1 Tax=Lentinula detonsa TaxID=2804962 RepID=A0A9W8P0H2_9AGAR|nr:hypothetical protein DFH05DRAFT_1616433 [Lentinula detonsa]